MANYIFAIPFIQAWEGGLSRATTDTASANPAPWAYNGVTGWHTNRGITYTTFQRWAPKFGYDVSAENFFHMPDDLWKKIFKIAYWDNMQLDNVNSTAVALLLMDEGWGSGPGTEQKLLSAYLKSKGIIATDTASENREINRLTLLQEEKTFRELVAQREEFFKALNQPANLKGWLNRLINGSGDRPSVLDFGLSLIKKKESPSQP
jgi:lysozyme family protein